MKHLCRYCILFLEFPWHTDQLVIFTSFFICVIFSKRHVYNKDMVFDYITLKYVLSWAHAIYLTSCSCLSDNDFKFFLDALVINYCRLDVYACIKTWESTHLKSCSHLNIKMKAQTCHHYEWYHIYAVT